MYAELPSFSLRPSPVYTISPGQTVHMPCAADGDPRPSIVWKKVNLMIMMTMMMVRSTRRAQTLATNCVLFSTVCIFTRHSCTGRYCWERVLAMGILSVCLSVRHDPVRI